MLLRPYDERFRLHQKLEAPLLNPRAASAYIPFQELESNQLLWDLMRSSNENGFDSRPHFERMTASAVYALFYGFRLKSASDSRLLAAHAVNQEFGQFVQVGAYLVDTFPSLNILPSFLAPWKRKAERHWQKQRALHVGNLQSGLERSSWNFSKQMHHAVEKENIDMPIEELALDIGIMADAALDATTETLLWFVVACITEDRGFVSKARGYLDAVVGSDRLPTFEDRSQLVYIDAVMEELLRWRPAGAAGVPHSTKIESTFEGYRIPAGSVVIANHWAITREEEVFGPDVEAFLPERWLAKGNLDGGKGGFSALRDLPTVGFGYGRRVCPGQHVARNGLWMTIAKVLWAFNIEPGLSNTGEQVIVDPQASTDGLVAKSLPFMSTFTPRGQWVRDLIEKDCNTHGTDHAGVLKQIGIDFARK